MEQETMFNKLAGRTPDIMKSEGCRLCAVAIPYLPGPQALLYQVRASTLRRQPGEISFPGGHVEAGETPRQAALRETREELLIREDQIHITAPLDILSHFGGSVIYPFLATLSGYKGSYSPAEVAEVFTVPFSFFLQTEPKVYYNEVSVTRVDEAFPFELIGGNSYAWTTAKNPVLFYQYEDRVIWGMTARITKNLVDLYRAAQG